MRKRIALRNLGLVLWTLAAASGESVEPSNHFLVIEVRTPRPRPGLAEGLLARSRIVKGVQAAAFVWPLSGVGSHTSTSSFHVKCSAEGSAQPAELAPFIVSPELFEMEGIHLERGRFFGASDNRNTVPVAILERSAAQSFWSYADPLGRRLVLPSQPGLLTVIGVVRDGPHSALLRADRPRLFLPFSQLPPAERFYLVVRTEGDPEVDARRIAAEVCSLDSSLLCRPIPPAARKEPRRPGSPG